MVTRDGTLVVLDERWTLVMICPRIREKRKEGGGDDKLATAWIGEQEVVMIFKGNMTTISRDYGCA